MKKVLIIISLCLILLLVLGVKPHWVLLIAGICILLIIIFVVLFFKLMIATERIEEEKWGEEYENDKKNGNLSPFKAYPCKPISSYTKNEAINKRIFEKTGIKSLIPAFTITHCHETPRDLTGDYSGLALIEFELPLSDEVFDEIEQSISVTHAVSSDDFDDSTNDHEPIPDNNKDTLEICLNKPFENGNHDDLFWSLTINRNSTTGKIVYGRV